VETISSSIFQIGSDFSDIVRTNQDVFDGN